jgi:hypothetical protein
MSRWIEREEEKTAGISFEGLSRTGSSERPRAVRAEDNPTDFGANRRELYLDRGRSYRIRLSEWETLFDLGRFRVIDPADLPAGVYGNDVALARADVRSLIEQGLAESGSFTTGGGERANVLCLTQTGLNLVKRNDLRLFGTGQQLYAGFVRPAEVSHDALVYRAYLKERARIHAAGGRIRRVRLDHELKREVYSRQYRGKANGRPSREVKERTATELELPVVDGQVLFPDLRIEYEDDRGQGGRVDIEVATGNYRGKHLQAKAQAGFSIYARGGIGLAVESSFPLKGPLARERRISVVSL